MMRQSATKMNPEAGKTKLAWTLLLLVLGFSFLAEQLYFGSFRARHQAISFLTRQADQNSLAVRGSVPPWRIHSGAE
jgi:hypothetical protein